MDKAKLIDIGQAIQGIGQNLLKAEITPQEVLTLSRALHVHAATLQIHAERSQ